MTITLENTAQFVEVNGAPARVWRGVTERGIEVHALIIRLAVLRDDETSEFEAELVETPAPRAAEPAVFPLRIVL